MMTGAPQSVLLPNTEKRHSKHQLGGKSFALQRITDDMNCARCGICADTSPQRAVIGFPTARRACD